MGENLTRKIIRSHLIEGNMLASQPIMIQIDQTLTQDLTGVLVSQYIAAIDPDALSVEKCAFIVIIM